jgi:hypothetical protein
MRTLRCTIACEFGSRASWCHRPHSSGHNRLEIDLHWEYADEPGSQDDWLDFSRVLYAYLHPRSRRPLYIGKADRLTVRQRMEGRHKDDVFVFFSELGLETFSIIVGVPLLPEGRRLSSALLTDVESLLIYTLRPPGNIQCLESRISRPGMLVTCRGKWPVRKRRFLDDAM